ncbi:angiopoietin-related protein 5-like isoform 2-T2 [Discoglossus pictus]
MSRKMVMFHHYIFRCLLLLSLHFQHLRSQTIDDQHVEGYDCSHIWERDSNSISGIYTIKPIGASRSFMVFCDMRADGGWTLIQKHDGQDGLSFSRTWAEYKLGFGNISSEHWLGLDNIHALTNQESRITELLISVGDFDGAVAFALYDSFIVGPETELYKLSVGNYYGNAGDAFRGKNNDTNEHGSFFSTIDKDNDNCGPCMIGDMRFMNCARFLFLSGWWFNQCGIANLNGLWHPKGDKVGWSSAVHWQTWRERESLQFSMMYLRH